MSGRKIFTFPSFGFPYSNITGRFVSEGNVQTKTEKQISFATSSPQIEYNLRTAVSINPLIKMISVYNSMRRRG
jgi:hypothetical protein